MICHCGKKLHYKNPDTRAQIEAISQKFGPYIDITIEGGRTFRVQRHYIALHGIRGKEIDKLGFQEVKHGTA